MTRRLLALLGAAVLLLTGLTSAQATQDTQDTRAAQAAGRHHAAPRPIVFVHGFAGSGGQFETPAKRFAVNGYPPELIEAHDYDSTFVTETREQVFARLDERIDRLLASTGADRVDLVGHSLGTAMSQAYLGTPRRAARVAHYVNLDGATAPAPPGGVPTLAVWGEGNAERAVTGATNVYYGDQAHTEVVTSPETFAAMYRFLTGKAPRTTRVLPERRGRALLSGRALLFPENTGVSGATLEVYEVHRATGKRRHSRPAATYRLTGDGSWGPFRGRGDACYEFAIVRPGAATHHLYFQPFRRTDRLIRLLTNPPGGGVGSLIETGDRHSALTVTRYKEWWGDQGAGSDVLSVNGRNVLNAANSPRTKRVIGIFLYDRGVDRVTDLTAPIPAFFALPFITGIDVYLPAGGRHPGRISVVVRQRGGTRPDVLNVPNWPSSDHRVSLQFDDHP
jgi:pimeloyl-ACP methyl ester carboxylesterase